MMPDAGSVSTVGEFRRPRVLVVDEDAERTLRFAVWLAGHDVTRVHRGSDALDHLREVAADADVDVVVVARRLPDMSGGAVLSSIRDRGIGVRVAMVCGPDESPPVTAAEVDTVLRTPLSPTELAGAVTDLLTRHDRQRLWLELSSKRVRRNVRSIEHPDVEPLDADIEHLATEVEQQASRLDSVPGASMLAGDGSP